MATISHQKARSLILLASQATLAPRDQQTLDAHLETCGACKTYIQTLAATQQKLSRTLHRRWDTTRARVSIQQIKTGSRRTLMFKKLTITAGTLAVVVVLALAIFSISGSLSPKKITASSITTTPTPQPVHPSMPIQLGPQNSMSVADWSPDGKRLIIRNDGELLLYVVNRDGTGLTKLPMLARSAHWSADGSSIQICVNPPENPKTSKIFSVSPDGSSLKELPEEEKVAALMDGNCDPVRSPDGKTIAFRKSDGLGLYFMDANGENIRQVIDSAEHDVVIHKWTVDAAGTSLLFSSLNPGSDLTLKQLNRITLNNAGASVSSEGLHQFTAAESAFWRISPDGQKIIYIPNSPSGIYADDDGWKKLVDLPLPDYFEQTVLWSPDSSQFAFMSTVTGDSDVFVVSADGSNLRHYPNPNALDQVISWSPDGLSLVFSSQAQPLTPPLYLYLLDVKDLQPYTDLRSITGPGACTLDPVHYVVAEGDLLNTLAVRFGASLESIIKLNKLDANGTISTGQSLLIPQAPHTLVDGANYTVSKNDTLDSIAATFGTSAESIRKVNYLDSAGAIAVGQMLIIPQAGKLPLFSNEIEMGIAIRWPLAIHSILAQDYSTLHPGLDIVANVGDPVSAGQPGVVIFAGATDGPLGNAIIIQHRNKMETIYAHLGELRVSCLESVSASQVIGTVGQTSGAAKAFLYFAIRKDGDPATPSMFMP